MSQTSEVTTQNNYIHSALIFLKIGKGLEVPSEENIANEYNNSSLMFAFW